MRLYQSLPFAILILLAGSCNRSIYKYEDSYDHSIETIELRNDGIFLYTHLVDERALDVRGEYEIKDGKILLKFNPVYENIDLLPTNDIDVSIDFIGPYDGTKIKKLGAFHKTNKDPLLFYNIEAYSKGVLLISTNTDLDGCAYFQTNKQIDFIKIYAEESTAIAFKLHREGEYEIEVLANVMGGTDSTSCGSLDAGIIIELDILSSQDKIMVLRSNESIRKFFKLQH